MTDVSSQGLDNRPAGSRKKSFIEAFEAFATGDISSRTGHHHYYTFETDDGRITFWKENLSAAEDDSVGHSVAIYYVEVVEHKRRTGVFSAFVIQLQRRLLQIAILGVGSVEMITCLRKVGGFTDRGGDFVWCKKESPNHLK